jgi:hypothetical protein
MPYPQIAWKNPLWLFVDTAPEGNGGAFAAARREQGARRYEDERILEDGSHKQGDSLPRLTVSLVHMLDARAFG